MPRTQNSLWCRALKSEYLLKEVGAGEVGDHGSAQVCNEAREEENNPNLALKDADNFSGQIGFLFVYFSRAPLHPSSLL